MNSIDMRLNPLFLRTGFEKKGFYEIPLVRKQILSISDIRAIPISKTKMNDTAEHCQCGVHFFEDDYRFTSQYNNPERSLMKLSQYAFLCTPDYSVYSDMDLWRQLESVAHSRWVGAFWQDRGLTVIPTVSWSNEKSFCFCFDGIVEGSDVAIATIGCKRNKKSFLYGYDAMIERIRPNKVLCVGKPFREMRGNVVYIPDEFPRRAVV